jgi:hypothetical protein
MGKKLQVNSRVNMATPDYKAEGLTMEKQKHTGRTPETVFAGTQRHRAGTVSGLPAENRQPKGSTVAGGPGCTWAFGPNP